ncbi:MAG: ferritin-like domain-containing protein [Myxococcota bacterium]
MTGIRGLVLSILESSRAASTSDVERVEARGGVQLMPRAPLPPVRFSGVSAPGALNEPLRGVVVNVWLRTARAEYASVFAFENASTHLKRLGAPHALLKRTEAARRDEIVHASLAFNLVGRLGGHVVQPGLLRNTRTPASTLAAFAAATVRNACIQQTMALTVAATRLRYAEDRRVIRVLETMVADETRHAELAWDTLRWALRAGGREVWKAVTRAFAEPRPCVQGPHLPRAAAAYGVLSARDLDDVVRRCMDDWIRPEARRLLGTL